MYRINLAKRFLSTKTLKYTNALSKPKNIDKILIANRGEIACRIIKTAHRMGVKTVAVYSDPDAKSLFVKQADEAFNIGPAASQESYLRGDKILSVAKNANCQAIHPGYGFLSENVEFADLCQKENVIFMGPPSSAIRDMGIKSTSKKIMDEAGVPIINGYHGEDQSDENLLSEAKKIGFPIMIKAVRGGGGKGMRIAMSLEEFIPQLESARTESLKAFGDSNMLLERYVRSPRHVEVQVFADQYGNGVYLFERDCSVQRRHQKIIEEAPAPGLSEELRCQLGEAAVRAAKAVGYVGAGTVEFILDKEDLSFHFMEMNTRLQVEHPITEMITGVDLVEWQIRIASGEPLPVTQEQIIRRGHAFEARVYAEDPRGGFLPGAGPLVHLAPPAGNDHVRVETGVRQGDEVSIHYDPMIAKLVVWGEDRDQALKRLISNLGDYHITGLSTNINFLIDLARHQYFQVGDVHTGFIDQHYDSLFPPIEITDTLLAQATASIILNELNTITANQVNSPFNNGNNFRLNHNAIRDLKLKFADKVYDIKVKSDGDCIQVKTGNDKTWKNVETKVLQSNEGSDRNIIQCNIDGVIVKFSYVISAEDVAIFNQNGKTAFEFVQPKFLSATDTGGAGDGSAVVSPMPGTLDRLLVKPGDNVKAGQPLAVIIAMKMEYVLKAPKDCIVKTVNSAVGKGIAKGAVIVSFEQ